MLSNHDHRSRAKVSNFEVLDGVDLDEAATKRLLRDFAEKLEGLGISGALILHHCESLPSCSASMSW